MTHYGWYIFLVSPFKGERPESEEDSCKFIYLHFDLGASCQPQWHHSILQGTLSCGEEVMGDGGGVIRTEEECVASEEGAI